MMSKGWCWVQKLIDLTALPLWVRAGMKNSRPVAFPTVVIVRDFCQELIQLPIQNHHHGVPFAPPYGVDSMNRPNPTCWRPSEGAGRGRLGGVLYKLMK